MQGLLSCAHAEGLLETVGSGAVARTLGLGVFVNTLRAQTRVGFPLVCVDVGVGGVGARWARRGRGVGADLYALVVWKMLSASCARILSLPVGLLVIVTTRKRLGGSEYSARVART